MEQQGGRRKEEIVAEAAGGVGFNNEPIVPSAEKGTRSDPIMVIRLWLNENVFLILRNIFCFIFFIYYSGSFWDAQTSCWLRRSVHPPSTLLISNMRKEAHYFLILICIYSSSGSILKRENFTLSLLSDFTSCFRRFSYVFLLNLPSAADNLFVTRLRLRRHTTKKERSTATMCWLRILFV